MLGTQKNRQSCPSWSAALEIEVDDGLKGRLVFESFAQG